MESITFTADDARYLALVRCGTKQASPIEVVMMDRGTRSGAPAVVVSFVAEVDGKVVTVQATTTARAFLMAAAAVRGRCERLGVGDLP